MVKRTELFYKIMIMLFSGIGVYLNFKYFTIKGSIVYYTVQSNLMCFIFYFLIIVLTLLKKLKKENIYYVFKGMVTMAVLITMIVYQLFLANTGAYDGHEFTSAIVHLIVPSLVIFDYLIFAEKGHLKKSHPYIWSLSLIVYFLFYNVYILLGGTFNDMNTCPYFFLSVDEFGYSGVIFNCMIIYVLFILFGKLVHNIDKKLVEV